MSDLCDKCKNEDDISLCSRCEDGSEYIKRTNADRIRSMSDEELAEYLYSIQNAEFELRFCKNKTEYDSELDKGQIINDSECKKCLVEWLQSEVEE